MPPCVFWLGALLDRYGLWSWQFAKVSRDDDVCVAWCWCCLLTWVLPVACWCCLLTVDLVLPVDLDEAGLYVGITRLSLDTVRGEVCCGGSVWRKAQVHPDHWILLDQEGDELEAVNDVPTDGFQDSALAFFSTSWASLVASRITAWLGDV